MAAGTLWATGPSEEEGGEIMGPTITGVAPR
jgi:hypothetical protein